MMCPLPAAPFSDPIRPVHRINVIIFITRAESGSIDRAVPLKETGSNWWCNVLRRRKPEQKALSFGPLRSKVGLAWLDSVRLASTSQQTHGGGKSGSRASFLYMLRPFFSTSPFTLFLVIRFFLSILLAGWAFTVRTVPRDRIETEATLASSS